MDTSHYENWKHGNVDVRIDVNIDGLLLTTHYFKIGYSKQQIYPKKTLLRLPRGKQKAQ